MHRWLMISMAAAPLVLSLPRPAVTPALVCWTTHALEKVRPSDPVPVDAPRSASISAARNEFEPFQIVLRAEGQTIDNVDVAISGFKGPNGAAIPQRDATVYFEAMLDLKTPSSTEGQTGEWPDPLIPRVDRYAGEKRNAFPFALTANRNQPIWIEVYVPPQTATGAYQAQIHITADERELATVPVNLEVWSFTLPSTSSLTNTFGFNGVGAVHQHYGKYTSDEDLERLTSIYGKAALMHRISIHGGAMRPPQFTIEKNQAVIDWRKYDAEVAPLLDGTAIAKHEPLYGAKATSIDLRTNDSADTDKLKVLYWRAFAKHIREKGWFDRLFNYLWDEPPPADFAAVLHKAQLVREADPRVPNLVTAPLNSQWIDTIDIWSPLVNCFETRAGFSNFCHPMVERQAYDNGLQHGKRLWWYQSCASHGCNVVGTGYFTGWPSYMIDISPVANRIMEWITWKYGVQGELYYSMNEAYNGHGKPWENVHLFGGNGDGTLFYPGLPERIGGKTHIPIESIRLKLIREGLEDYEYLHMLDRSGATDVATEIVNEIVHTTYDFNHDAAKLYAARSRMAEELNRRGEAAK